MRNKVFISHAAPDDDDFTKLLIVSSTGGNQREGVLKELAVFSFFQQSPIIIGYPMEYFETITALC